MKGLQNDTWNEAPARWESSWKWIRRIIPSALIVLIVIGISRLTPIEKPTVYADHNGPRYAISPEERAIGEARCAANQQRPQVNYNLASSRLAKLSPATSSPRTIWKNATLIDGDGKVTQSATVIFREGIIEQIQNSSTPMEASVQDNVLDLNGRYVTPGLIEMHSHAGVRELPQMWANQDVTELGSGPLTPWARAIDGYKSNDVGIELSAGGGMTSALVLTGASSIVSGEGYVYKMKRDDSPYAQLIDTSVEFGGKPQRFLKMALGENIKKAWEDRPGGLNTRQGISFHFRQAMEKAQQLKRRQDNWCEALSTHQHAGHISEPYPESLELQTLVDLLRGDIKLQVHCYETEDVYSLFDHADEFGFNVSTVHHALASHLMIDELQKRNVSVATFSDEWGFKVEIYDTSFTNLTKLLFEAKVPLILTTDHPATYGKLLLYTAQVAYHYGVSNEMTIASVIAEPAKALGLDNRIGYLRPGYDADLVVWDKHPLRIGATPLMVVIDGETTINATSKLWEEFQPVELLQPPPQRPERKNDEQTCSPGQKNLIVQGIREDYFNDDNSDMAPSDAINSTATAVIRNGRLECIGKHECRRKAEELLQDHFPVINLTNGYVTAGLTMVTKQYGLGEIPYEDSTMNGKNGGLDLETPEFTKEALRFGEQHLERPHRKGVTRLITPPMTDGFFHGVSAVFRTGASSRLDTHAVPVEDLALHFTIAHVGKQPSLPTVSKQLHQLRELLTTKQDLHPLYKKAARGELPVVVHTDNKDIMAQLVLLKRDTGANIIVMGGAEAHLLADELAQIHIPVILTAGWCHPFTWDERRCLVGPPHTELGNADVLLNAGVLLGLGNWDYRQGHVEDALWEASWTVNGMKRPRVALDMLSRNIDKMFGLDGSKQDVVIHEGNPLDFGSSIAVILEAGAVQRCWPEVEPPRGSNDLA